MVGHGPPFRGGAAVKHTRQAVIWVIGGEEARLMSLGRQLLGESFNVAAHTTWIRVRVGRYQRYTHGGMVAAPPVLHSAVRHTVCK